METTAVQEFRLPDVGEGLTEAEIVTWKVKVGDTVAVNDVVVEIETAKSLVELPVPFAGVVSGLLVPEGQTVPVGTPIIAVSPVGAAAGAVSGNADAEAPPAAASGSGSPAPAVDKREAVLVGYGVRQGAATRRPRKAPAAAGTEPAAVAHAAAAAAFAPGPVSTQDVQALGETVQAGSPVTPPATLSAPTDAAPTGVLAKPPVRKLAKELGVDLRLVRPTGAGGVLTRDDVRSAATGTAPSWTDHESHDAGTTELELNAWTVEDVSGEREHRVPIRSVRKATATAMVASAFTAVHVSEWLTLDVTRTVKLVEKLKASREFRDVRLTPLAVLAKAICIAVRRTPEVNTVWDEAAQQIVYKRYVNLGIAAATPRGLVVPNLKDAHRMSLAELANGISELAATARAGKTQPAQMAGGTLSITNVGVFGVDAGTPILPPGEALIVAFGAVKQQPWVHKGAVKARWVTTLAVSFDHRLVDGEQGSRFLADVGAILHDPAQVLAWA